MNTLFPLLGNRACAQTKAVAMFLPGLAPSMAVHGMRFLPLQHQV